MEESSYNSSRNLILFIIVVLLWTWVAGMIPVMPELTGTPIGTIIFYSGVECTTEIALINGVGNKLGTFRL